MSLAKPVTAPASQDYGGNFASEPEGWFVRSSSGRPLKAYLSHFPGSVSQLKFHKGVDLYCPLDTPLLACEDGTVVFAAANASTGYAKVIRVQIKGHPGVRYSHGHCNSLTAKVGDTVKRGQGIAKAGKTGNANGVHDHFMVEILETGSDGVKRWMAYDPLAFLPAGSYRMGAPYGGKLLPGGSLANDDRIYPIHNVVIAGPGVNVRQSPDTKAPVVVQTVGPTVAPQINAVPGGEWSVGAVTGTTWAKVLIGVGGKTAYVATALIKPA